MTAAKLLSVNELLEAALALSPKKRRELADALNESLTAVKLDPQQHATVKSRIQEIEDGDVELLTWEDVDRDIGEALEVARRARHA